MNESLLPFNSTQAERNLSLVMKRSSNLPVNINHLWNPFRCPENLLPWLAWSLSVDNWNSAWPTPVKRQQIANSIEIHRRKGTVSAVKKAMAVFGVQVELSEWFETKSTPHTFSVMAWAGDNFRDDHEPVLTEAYYGALKRAIDYSKPVRSHYDFKVGVLFGSDVGIGVVQQSLAIKRVDGEFIYLGAGLDGDLNIGGINQGHSVTRISMEL